MPIVSLVRHGQASFGAADYDQLSPLGVQQAEHLGTQLKERGEKIDLFVRGSLKRHAQSLDTFLAAYGASDSDILIDAAWNEFDHRAVMRALVNAQPDLHALFTKSGAPQADEAEILSLFMQSVERWQSGLYNGDYEEPWCAFVERVQQAWTQLQSHFQASRILILTSGGPIAISATATLGLPPEQMLGINKHLVNAGISRFMCRTDQWNTLDRKLLSLNEHGHLLGRYQHLLTYR